MTNVFENVLLGLTHFSWAKLPCYSTPIDLLPWVMLIDFFYGDGMWSSGTYIMHTQWQILHPIYWLQHKLRLSVVTQNVSNRNYIYWKIAFSHDFACIVWLSLGGSQLLVFQSLGVVWHRPAIEARQDQAPLKEVTSIASAMVNIDGKDHWIWTILYFGSVLNRSRLSHKRTIRLAGHKPLDLKMTRRTSHVFTATHNPIWTMNTHTSPVTTSPSQARWQHWTRDRQVEWHEMRREPIIHMFSPDWVCYRFYRCT